MKEKIFNCYAIVDDDLITRIAMKDYRMSGTDDEKESFLRETAPGDFTDARQFPVPDNFIYTDMFSDTMITGTTWGYFRCLLETGEYMALFEKGFEALGASAAPLINLSVVRDGAFIPHDDVLQK